jgi:hypothetical protein
VDGIREGLEYIKRIHDGLSPSFLHNYLPEFVNSGISTDALWNQLEPVINDAQAKLEAAINKLSIQQVKFDPQEEQSDPGVEKFTALITQLTSYLPRVSKYPQDVEWINGQIKAIKDLIEKVNQEGMTNENGTTADTLNKEVSDYAISRKLV